MDLLVPYGAWSRAGETEILQSNREAFLFGIPGPLSLLLPGITFIEGEENFVGDSEIIALRGASNETKDRPLG